MSKKPKNDETVPDYAAEIDPLEIDDHFLKLPAQVAYWNNLYAEAYRTWLTAKRNLEQTFAQLYVETRDEAESSRAKTTEATIKATIEIDDRYVAAADALVVAEAEKVRLQGVMEALRVKRDALMSVGASMRAERAGNPSIRRNSFDD